MKCVILQPYECWDYAKEHEEELIGEEHEIASEEEFGVQICMHVQDNLPVFDVYVDGEIQYTAFAFTEDDCFDVVSDLYNDFLDDFLSTAANEILDEEEDTSDWAQENMIADQESSIDCAIEELIDVLYDCWFDDPDYTPFTVDETEEIKDHFCEYMARRFKNRIYRPMYLYNENGDKFFVTHPYEVMEFDEPIYS